MHPTAIATFCNGASSIRPASIGHTAAARPLCSLGLLRKALARLCINSPVKTFFDPLGMGLTEWATGHDGEPFAASGARMSVRDLARLGQMMLHDGKVGDRPVVPADWVTRCITPVVSADEIRRYGYQWFVLDIAFGKPKGWAVGRLERMWTAQGEGGQRLFINYGKDDQGCRQREFCAR
jgi:Beta-lactamase